MKTNKPPVEWADVVVGFTVLGLFVGFYFFASATSLPAGSTVPISAGFASPER